MAMTIGQNIIGLIHRVAGLAGKHGAKGKVPDA
jgi:hypothetical protein